MARLSDTRRVTLYQGPEGSPNFCFGLYDGEGREVTFVQSDWDYPGLARSLGWDISKVLGPVVGCGHDGTDGTITCPACGAEATLFISAAFDWLAENDGEVFDYHD